MKIRIKKVTALLLSCMLFFSISGCQKKRTAKEVLKSSLKQSSKLKDADFSGEASYKIANSEASSSMTTICCRMDGMLSVSTICAVCRSGTCSPWRILAESCSRVMDMVPPSRSE